MMENPKNNRSKRVTHELFDQWLEEVLSSERGGELLSSGSASALDAHHKIYTLLGNAPKATLRCSESERPQSLLN